MRRYNQKYFVLCIDLEKFDLPSEFGYAYNEIMQYNISYKGAQKIIELLTELNIKATFFTTLGMAVSYPELVKALSQQKHEIALHYDFDKVKGINIQKAKKKLENIAQERVIGFRAHRFGQFKQDLKKLGFVYNNSLHPTLVPGRYCNIFRSTKMSYKNGVWHVPISVSAGLRLPFSWLWFRNFGLNYAKLCTKTVYLTQQMVNIYFHPWDFYNIGYHQMHKSIPAYIYRNSGDKCLKLLSEYLKWLRQKKIIFITFRDYLR